MGFERTSSHSDEPGRDLPPTYRQRNSRARRKRSRNPGGKVSAKYFDYLSQRASQLFRISNRVSVADHVRADLRLLLLERAGLFRFDGHGIADARADDADEYQRNGDQ